MAGLRDDVHDELHDDLDDLDALHADRGAGSGGRSGGGGELPGAGARRGRPPASPRRRVLLGAAAALAVAVAVGVRHAGADDADDGAPSAAPSPSRSAPAPDLPADVADDQRIAVAALRAADRRLTAPDWSRARTDAQRDPAARTGDGRPLLVDVVQFAPIDYGGRQPDDVRRGSGVGYRISTPLRPPEVTDACRAAGVVAPPLLPDGTPEPACIVAEHTTPRGEVQRVALREWQQAVPARNGTGPVRVVQPQWVRQAVLVTDRRWTFAVATTTVGAEPELDASELDLAVRWIADAARGLPTPSSSPGAPLPGSGG